MIEVKPFHVIPLHPSKHKILTLSSFTKGVNREVNPVSLFPLLSPGCFLPLPVPPPFTSPLGDPLLPSHILSFLPVDLQVLKQNRTGPTPAGARLHPPGSRVGASRASDTVSAALQRGIGGNGLGFSLQGSRQPSVDCLCLPLRPPLVLLPAALGHSTHNHM